VSEFLSRGYVLIAGVCEVVRAEVFRDPRGSEEARLSNRKQQQAIDSAGRKVARPKLEADIKQSCKKQNGRCVELA